MITIFTPTYNRAYRLPSLYQSLLRQTDRRFEWVIVDDGSTDDTAQLAATWTAETDFFPIRYYYQENTGKHSAINTGVQHSRYDWFFIVDSDDFLTDNAVEKIHQWIATVDREDIAAVSGLKCFSEREIIGRCCVKAGHYIDARNNERRKYGLLGDKAEVYRTDILKQFPFPVFPGERFLAESAVWDAIALAGYRIRWFSDPIMVCEYLEDGLTAQLRQTDIEIKSFEGCTYCAQVGVRAYHGLERLQIICRYINKAKQKGLSIKEVSDRIKISRWECSLCGILVVLKNTIRRF